MVEREKLASASRAYGRRWRETVGDLHRLLQAVIAIVTLAISGAAAWRFGFSWGLVTLLACALGIAVIAGLKAEAEIDGLRTATPDAPVDLAAAVRWASQDLAVGERDRRRRVLASLIETGQAIRGRLKIREGRQARGEVGKYEGFPEVWESDAWHKRCEAFIVDFVPNAPPCMVTKAGPDPDEALVRARDLVHIAEGRLAQLEAVRKGNLTDPPMPG